MNALAILVSAANAKSESATTGVAVPPADGIMDCKNGEQKAAATVAQCVPGGAVAAAVAAQENAVKMRYLQEIRKEEEELSKERLASIMLQREREKQEQAAVHQATIMRLIGRGSPSAVTAPPVGVMSPAPVQSAVSVPPPGVNPHQEAEYLQQLRLEALVQQSRQETLAKLSESSNGNLPGSPASKPASKEVVSHKFQRQDTAIQKAILMARADEELRKQQLEQRDIEKQLEQEQQRKHLQQNAMLQMMANGDNSNAFINALRAASGPAGLPYPGGPNSEDRAVLQLLEERQRQRIMAQHNSQAQQPHLELQRQLQHHLQAQRHGNSVASAPMNPHQSPISTHVLTAIAAAAEEEKQKLLRLQNHRENNHESFQSSGISIDQQQHLQQQALIHQQQQAAALVQQQQESSQRNREMKEPHTTVEQDAAFHDSKSTILPCRARGMPMDHNVKTAYFVIPPNISHGTELLCSYFTCRNAGIKFRYCVYCKLPVAKRNFAKRHKHSGKIVDAVSTESAVDGTPRDDSAPRCIIAPPLSIEEKHKGAEEDPMPDKKESSADTEVKKEISSSMQVSVITEMDGDISSKSSSAVNEKELAFLDVESSKTTKNPVTKNSNELSSSKDDHPVCTSSKVSPSNSKRRKAWEKLLLQRPKDTVPTSAAMQGWIGEVLRISDLDTEFDSDGETQSKTNPLHTGVKNGNVKKFKKALLSRKEREDMEEEKVCDDKSKGNGNIGIEKLERVEEDTLLEDTVDKTEGKRDSFPDDASTSSEESVDLRVRKKPRNGELET